MIWRSTVAALGLLVSVLAQAHPLAPALLELRQQDDATWSVLWRQSSLKNPYGTLEPQLPTSCRPNDDREIEFESAISTATRWTITCPDANSLNNEQIGVAGLAGSPVNVILRIIDSSGKSEERLLDSDNDFYLVATAAESGPVWQRYLLLGMEHLAFGPDHLLFLLGLMFLALGLKQLIWTLTAFTIGHSITLSLAALNLIQVNAALMEFGIAVTLVVLARELLRDRPSLFGRHPMLMAATFGLVHGLGFAGALSGIGLPPDSVLIALLSFNVGIELAQILIALGVLALANLAGRRLITLNEVGTARPNHTWTVAAAYTIGTLAMLWCMERFLTLGQSFSA